MIEKHARRDHKAASFAPRVSCKKLVYKPRRASRCCKSPRIVELSWRFVHLAAFAHASPCRASHLRKGPRAHSGSKIRNEHSEMLARRRWRVSPDSTHPTSFERRGA